MSNGRRQSKRAREELSCTPNLITGVKVQRCPRNTYVLTQEKQQQNIDYFLPVCHNGEDYRSIAVLLPVFLGLSALLPFPYLDFGVKENGRGNVRRTPLVTSSLPFAV